jgi:hypothetical protein
MFNGRYYDAVILVIYFNKINKHRIVAGLERLKCMFRIKYFDCILWYIHEHESKYFSMIDTFKGSSFAI